MSRTDAANDRKRRRCMTALRAVVALHNPLFVTFTSADLEWDDARRAWSALRSSLKREMRMDFGYARVIAKTDGEAGHHVHALMGGASPGWRPNYNTMRRLAEQAGFGFKTSIAPVRLADQDRLIGYIADHVDDRRDKERPVPLGRRSFEARLPRT